MNTILNYLKIENKKSIEDRRIVKPSTASIPWLKTKPVVCTASIRTDVFSNPPYFRRLLQGLREKKIQTLIPRQGLRIIDLSDMAVLSCWSKNYELFIKEWENSESLLHDIPLIMFNFTINGESKDCELENIKASLDDRLWQLKWLIENFGMDSINVRFDPITHWTESGIEKNNLDEYVNVLDSLQMLNIKRLTFSFCVEHDKVIQRMARHGKILIIKTLEQKQEILLWMMEEAHIREIVLRSCCEDDLVGFEIKSKIDNSNIKILKSICVDRLDVVRLLAAKGKSFNGRTKGNRPECGCVETTDIFSYNDKCMNGCLYCYANPNENAIKRNITDIEEII